MYLPYYPHWTVPAIPSPFKLLTFKYKSSNKQLSDFQWHSKSHHVLLAICASSIIYLLYQLNVHLVVSWPADMEFYITQSYVLTNFSVSQFYQALVIKFWINKSTGLLVVSWKIKHLFTIQSTNHILGYLSQRNENLYSPKKLYMIQLSITALLVLIKILKKLQISFNG